MIHSTAIVLLIIPAVTILTGLYVGAIETVAQIMAEREKKK